MAGFTLWNRLSRIQGGTNLQPGDNSDLVDTSQGLTQIQGLKDLTNTGSGKFSAGTGTLVTGTIVIATGLTLCTSFTATMIGTGATATGAAEVERVTVASITTGAVSVVGSYHSATAAVMVPSASGTGSFYWQAYGT